MSSTTEDESVYEQMERGEHPDFEIVGYGTFRTDPYDDRDSLRCWEGARFIAYYEDELGNHPELLDRVREHFCLYYDDDDVPDDDYCDCRDWVGIITDTREMKKLQAGDIAIVDDRKRYVFLRPKFDWGFEDDED